MLVQSVVQRGGISGFMSSCGTQTALPQLSSTCLHAATPSMLVAGASSALKTLAPLRGGAAAALSTALDMEKETQNIAVLSSYGVVTVLVLNSALRLYTSTKIKRDPSKKYDWVLTSLFSLFSGLCVISGAFTGVMFQLLRIYAKSALGMGNIEGYKAFQAATAPYTNLGFHTFLVCLSSFVGTFLINFYNMTRDDDAWGGKIFCLMAFLTLAGGVVIKHILNLATLHIFAPPI
eukprot:scaffold2597_cov116-Cylindrotheca_fusiformis.AAC.4